MTTSLQSRAFRPVSESRESLVGDKWLAVEMSERVDCNGRVLLVDTVAQTYHCESLEEAKRDTGC